jgi:membrane peptidoglycan carboxypeptidase
MSTGVAGYGPRVHDIVQSAPRAEGSPSARRALSRIAAALFASALIGVLLALLALPVIGAAGLTVRDRAEDFLVLSSELDVPALPERTTVLAADGSLVATFFLENRISVPLEDVPQVMRDALLAIEDSRFYEHNGVDLKGTLRAALRNSEAGQVREGGSTLTQQYVKNALLQLAETPQEQAAAREASFERKLQEARYALAVERELGKDEILQRYLDIAYFGNGVYGIGTAATFYFSTPVQELTLAQSAVLAGLVQSPGRHDPVRNPEAATQRRDVVLRRMLDVGAADQAQVDEALATPLELRLSPIGSGCEAPGVAAPFFCDHVRRVLEDTDAGAALGATREERQQRILGGGLTIRTSLDPVAQAAGQRAVDERVPREDESGIAAAFTGVEPGTGLVKALAVNRTFGEDELPGQTKLNLAIGGSSGMQAGSTFKPFVLAAALEQGIPLETAFNSPNEYTSPVFTTCEDGRCGEPYTVRNAGDSQAGTFNLVSGTHSSVNTFYVQLQERTGVDRPVEIAESMGLRQFEGGSPTAPLLRAGSFTLGTNEVSPLAMSAAYATFAASGTYCPPRAVLEVLDKDGTPLPLPEHSCAEVLRPDLADTVTSVLRGVVDGPLPGRTGQAASLGRPAAGKTGSTNGSRAAWFVGYTPQLAGSVWVGKPVPEEMKDVRIAGTFYRQVYGGTLPAPIWAQAMRDALADAPVLDLAPLVAPPANAPASTAAAPSGPSTATARPRAPSAPAPAAPPAPRQQAPSGGGSGTGSGGNAAASADGGGGSADAGSGGSDRPGNGNGRGNGGGRGNSGGRG